MESLAIAIRQAIIERNPTKAQWAVQWLRHKQRLSYDEIFMLVNNMEPISHEDWQTLIWPKDGAA